jgi:MFS family permease
VGGYGNLLRTPGVARLLTAQLTARFPNGMLSLAYLLHVEHLFGSYGAAGLVLAATSIGQAIAGPLTSRWMGRWGMRPVLILTTVVCAISMITMALTTAAAPLGFFMGVGFVGGLATPPVQPAVRTIYPKMVNSRQLSLLFSLDASAQEIIWIAAPVLITFVSVQLSSTLGILIAVAFLVIGGAWFISSPELGKVRIPRTKRRFGVVLTRPPVLLATVVGFLVIGSCSALEASVVAEFGEGGPQAGFILAIWSIASLGGGLLLGSRPIGPSALARRTIVIAVGCVLAALVGGFWPTAATLVVAGICLAPALAVMFAIVSASVRFSDTAEAYGWVGTGQLIGSAAGSAVAGFVIDESGPDGGFWVGAAFALAGFLVSFLFRGAHPDLRGRDASPIPDTDSVPVQPS